MRRDKVTSTEVEICISHSDFSSDQLSHEKIESWKKFGQRFLKVIHTKEGQDEFIITVVIKKNPPQ